MRIKFIMLGSFLLCTGVNVTAKPPEPELGKRWSINYAYSDEFNQTSLDRTKWRDHFNTWKGRPPAKFVPSAVTLSDGFLQIKNHKLKKTDGPYTIGGGAIQSLNQGAYHGYYEARFKASRINMSTTFWLSNKNVPFEGENFLGESCSEDSWALELDIAEAVGGVIDAPFGALFRTGQQYNTHVWYRGCKPEDSELLVDPNSDNSVMNFYGRALRFSKGTNVAEGDGTGAPGNAKLANGKEVWQDFNTYAAWWKNENEVDFYLNDQFSGHISIDTTLSARPYNRPMQINMVTETYDWAKPYPTDEQLADNSINTSYYDWIRAYVYLDVTEQHPNSNNSNESAGDIFDERVEIKSVNQVLNTLEVDYVYESDIDIDADILLTKDSKTLTSKQLSLKAGYGHLRSSVQLKTAIDLDKTNIQIVLKSGDKTIAHSKTHEHTVNVK